MRRLIYALLLSTALFSTAEAKRVALVIGNSNYEHVTDLVNPANDAAVMEQALQDAGFEVMKFTDLDQRGMKNAMKEFGQKLRLGADAGMFYYAGHGIEVDGRNYLVPVDSNTQGKEEADIENIELNNFLRLMENSGVPLNIVVLDACRNNPFRGFRSASGGLAPVLAPAGTFVAYATAAGSVAADGTGRNSPFTQSLAEVMKTPGLTLESVFKQTRSKVRAITGGEQVPYESTAIEGDFYFHEAVAVIPVAPPTPVVEKAPLPPLAPVLEQVAVLPVPPLEIPSVAPVVSNNSEVKASPAEVTFRAAGNDPALLKVVVWLYGDSIWGKLAAARLKVLDSQLALVTPLTPEITTAPEVTPPPASPPAGLRVAADGTGTHTSIVDAVAAAKPGDRIEVLPGRYTGGIFMDKGVDIVGVGNRAEIVWSNSGTELIYWKTEGGSVSNMTLVQEGNCTSYCYVVYFDASSGRVESNDITSQGTGTIVVTGAAAKPIIRSNVIHDSKETGILLVNNSEATVEQNIISGNKVFGILVADRANPLISQNEIRDNLSTGIFVSSNSLGTIDGNNIAGNNGGLGINDGANPIVRNNQIVKNKLQGIYIYEKGSGTFENNTIIGNTDGPWFIHEAAGKVTRSGNKI